MIRANVDSGEFDQRVVFERKTVTQGAKGQQNEGWLPILQTGDGAVWARVDGMRAGERFTDAALTSLGAYTVWVRSDVVIELALTQNDRMVWDGLKFDIKDIPNQQRKGRKIAIFVQVGLNQG